MTTPDSAPSLPPDERPLIRGHLAELAGIARTETPDATPPSTPDVTGSSYTGRMGGVEIGRGAVDGTVASVDSASAAPASEPSRATGSLLAKFREGAAGTTSATAPTAPPETPSTPSRERPTVTPRNSVVAAGPRGSFLEKHRTGGRYEHGMELRHRDTGAVWIVEGVTRDPRTGKVLVVLQPPDGGPTVNKSPDELDSQLAEKNGAWSRMVE